MLFDRDLRGPRRDEDDVPMFSVIFEVYPKEARFDDYLALSGEVSCSRSRAIPAARR
jgi:hypothetical protein